MSKFQVGDYVIGNDSASENYSITITGWIGVVSRASNSMHFFQAVSVDDYENFGLFDDDGLPFGYTLEDKCFDLFGDIEFSQVSCEELDSMFEEFA